MKRILLSVFMVLCVAQLASAQTGVRIFGAQQFMLDDNNIANPKVYLSQNLGSLGIDNSGVVSAITFPSACALLDLRSTTKGFLPPRMNSVQEIAVCGGTPTEGLMVYNTTSHTLDVYNGTLWGAIAPSWGLSGNTGTTPATNFLGTIDNVALFIQVKNGAIVNNSFILNTNGSIQRDNAGNARGLSAVDLQIVRGSVTQVASGSNSFIGGGQNNSSTNTLSTVGGGINNNASGVGSFIGGGGFDGITVSGNTAGGGASVVGGGLTNSASGIQSVVGGGQNNRATNNNATVGGGVNNNASGFGAFIGGGGYNGAAATGNTASGNASVVSGGFANIAQADYSSVIGGRDALASQFGQMAQSSGAFATQGDAQTSVFILRKQSPNAVPVSLALDGGATKIVVPTNGAYTFHALIVGKTQGSPATVGGWEITGLIYNNAGTATIVGANITRIYNTPAGWGLPTVTGSGTNMDVQVIGAVGTTIDWVASVHTSDVVF